MDSNVAKTGVVTFLAAGLAVAGLSVVHNAQQLDQAGKIVMAAGNPQYAELAAKYQRDLKRFGVEVDIRTDTQGFATLRALTDNNSGITAGFVKGGLIGSLQGRLASEKAKGRHGGYAQLRSVGRLFYEPIWVFTRGDLPITTLRDLAKKKILIGTRKGGGRRIATQLLLANDITKDTATFIDEELAGDGARLKNGEADAAILVLAADSDTVQQLLRVDNIRLMDFTPEAEAYTNRFPALTKAILRTGAVDFNPLLPSADITLLTTSVALAVRPSMEAALVSLLTQAVINNPVSGFDKHGDPVLFYKPGQFPSPDDPELQIANDARLVYKSGELPFTLRVLAPITRRMGLPFSYTAYASNHAAKLVLLIPVLAVILPLTKGVPAIYIWYVRRRLLYWYNQLKSLERSLDAGGARFDPDAVQAEFDRIDQHVRRIRLPNFFSHELYDLRGHIELMRQRLCR
jgi:TRAP-type uncharacterized transport system substrate-binding protein